MITLSDSGVWLVILALGAGTFLIRWSFLGALGRYVMPTWVLRLLRYTPVAVLPALVAPLVMWPAATEGQTDPARLVAAIATVAVGMIWKNMLAAILAGAGTLVAMLQFLG
ncbi:AzlD domain-containing protein [Paracoccus sp. M683]|uniref:AzlD domain-containing protein n=1 Tax=Paracoccus sp. M683 TaxID=2594268 RepID=UPI00117CCEE0|nr:AzlD domain-containing protein [Paracoccus sp. M683]TRW99313.1 AzlD domain-containing protein [Paracoccus sp. M683]